MRPALAATLLFFTGSCCFRATGAGSTGNASGGSTTGAIAGTASGGQSGTSSSGGGTTGAGTGGAQPCGPQAVWIGDVCAQLSCPGQLVYSACILGDGGIGFCAAGQCQGADLFSDPGNCGGWGTGCAGDAGCSHGRCSLPCGPDAPCPAGTSCGANGSCTPTNCAPGQTDDFCWGDDGSSSGFCCGTSCAASVTDSENCGACGRSCSDAEYCFEGLCLPASTCSDGGENDYCRLPGNPSYPGFCCHGACQDPTTDTQDCLACGQSCLACGPDAGCPAGSGCTVDGLCAPTSCLGLADGVACSTPPAPAEPFGPPTTPHWFGHERILTECCAGACVDLDFSAGNCGACGQRCPAGLACQGGYCGPIIDCSAATNGTPCGLPDAGGEGFCCAGACVNPLDDSSNCGGCGYACPPGSTCAANRCVEPGGGNVRATITGACNAISEGEPCLSDAGYGTCCGGACLDPAGPAACSTCGLGCTPCLGGCPAGTACVNTNPDGIPSQVCSPLSCPSGVTGARCAFGPEVQGPSWGYLFTPAQEESGFCCDGACVDTSQDPDNCGTCGVVCASGLCGRGLCVPAAPDSDCQVSCGPNALCVNGNCADSSCLPPEYCQASDGKVGVCCGTVQLSPLACADVANDPANCGGCGFQCPAGQACVQGECTGAPANCGAGRIGAFCNLDAGLSSLCCPGVGCTDTASDPLNCGACGNECRGGRCVSGACQ
ncbi:MAG TPA: hypothetical protein VMB50_07815 [Myxococcales bacterium]|nr:hypothetical protein [Myxococcales bacterium]